MSEIVREEMEVDVLLVGAGPANLACAYHLQNLIEKNSGTGGSLGETLIMVIDKGAHVGAHVMSGAVLDPVALNELIPNWKDSGAPVTTAVSKDAMLYLTKSGKFTMPWVPASMHHHGCYLISLNKLAIWLGEQVEAKGCEVFPGTAGAELLFDGSKVIGVQTDDKGLDKESNQKTAFEPGMLLKARVTVLGEGTRGHLTRALTRKLDLDKGRNPQTYTTGVKELWEFPEGTLEPGLVYHLMGYPLGNSQFGGGFIYHLSDTLMSIGLVVGLNYRNPFTESQALFSQMKAHPHIRSMLEKGKMVRYGAKTIPEGGYWSIPRNYGDGFLITGDSSSLLNPARLKGIHLAMKSGMLAAETIFDALKKDDTSAATLSAYNGKLRDSFVHKEMFKYRYFPHMFHRGIASAPGFILKNLFTGFRKRPPVAADHLSMQKLQDYFGSQVPDPEATRPKADGKLIFNKIDSVYYSGSTHEEDQPAHLQIGDLDTCVTKCAEEYGNPCRLFCPASVYEIEENEGRRQLKINASNCVHCKTCDIADPYGNITWVNPEGGGGPNFDGL
ncbi:MAG: electron transfer flavoprotein-ubiquinone oxidoreductase [candidate division Zixibacteria bacterium]|nr:electron transfer flavoprotein-ubiquinone oxidoreductase [candidate division Zixibacteria bacterium]